MPAGLRKCGETTVQQLLVTAGLQELSVAAGSSRDFTLVCKALGSFGQSDNPVFILLWLRTSAGVTRCELDGEVTEYQTAVEVKGYVWIC